MPDIVTLRADNVPETNRIVITSSDSSADAPNITQGVRLGPTLESLLNQGFAIRFADSDANGAFYTLIRDTTTCNTIPFLTSLIGTTITVDTAAGDVSGILTLVGTDVIQLLEATGDIVLIPISSINSVS